jgi:hypothetical protein
VKLATAIWSFIAGDSRRAPIAVALAVAVAAVLVHAGTSSGIVATTFAGMIALALTAAVFERT